MSHNVLIKNVKITSIRALQRAVDELKTEGVNVSLVETNRFRTYQGQPNRCDYCIALPGERHDVGLVKQEDGSYLPYYDPYGMSRNGNGISCQLNENVSYNANEILRSTIGKLLQRYSTCVAEDAFADSGQWCSREVNENGDIVLTAEVY